MNLKDRLSKLRQKFPEKGIDAIFISQPENRYYLSGFYGSAGFLLITPQKAILATDFRYLEQAERQAPDYEIFRISGDISSWFPKLIANLKLKSLGFEASHITFTMHRQLCDILNKEHPQIELKPLEGLGESLRAVKEPEEIELITKASKISDGAIKFIDSIIHAGMSEKDVAWAIEKFLREHGSEPIPFDIIVAAGPNSALPHAHPSSRVILDGEPVIIDIGARINGYSSDLSRTICSGNHSDTFKKVYDTVLTAQLKAISTIKEGMTGSEIDSSARKIIEQAGYGEAFGHGLGHGIGLAPHELPRIAPSSSDQIIDNMIFTIEPGIYLTGWGGVRIEDIAILENGKSRVISEARK